MDLITVDVTGVPEHVARRGAWVELIGRNMPPRACRPGRHHRLRGPHQSRRPRSAALYRRLASCSWQKPREPSSAKPAARSPRAGQANAPPAASGTRIIEETAAPSGSARADRHQGRQGQSRRLRELAGGEPRRAAATDRHGRVRSRARRRPSAGLGRPGRRRSRHRQIDAAAPGCRQARPDAARRVVYLSGEEAPAQVRMRAARLGLAASPGSARHRDQCRQHRRHPEQAPVRPRWSSSIRCRRCGPRDRGRARHHLAAARLRLGAGELRQGQRLDARARRPCDQGWPDRRAQGHRAHGRHRALFRRR